jgi:uncharacterized protein YqjF (DUF2071 family)
MQVGARTRDVCFAHWPVDPDVLTTRLPHALSVATHDGVGWVSLVAMRTRPLFGAVGLPSAYSQVTLRTYARPADDESDPSIDESSARSTAGDDGEAVHFLRVDADSRAASLVGRRLFDVPFHHVDAQMTAGDDEVKVRTHAPDGTPLFVGAFTVPDEVGQVAEGTRLSWVTGRTTYALADGRVGHVEHDPWTVGEADLDLVRNDLLGSEGLPEPLAGPLVRYSPGADVRLASWPS